MLAPIFNNQYFKITYRPPTLVDENLTLGENFKKVTLAQLMVDNTVISKDNLEILLAVQVAPEKYRILKKACGDWNRKYNNGDIDKRSETFKAFFNRFKKG